MIKPVEIKKGFIEKQSRGGGFFKFSKLRYVVIELGLLIYYTKKRSSLAAIDSYSSISQSDGEDEKGRMNLYGARIENNAPTNNNTTNSSSDASQSSETKNSARTNNSNDLLTIHIISGFPDKEPDLVLKAGSHAEALEWKQAIKNHIAYANENEKLLASYSSSSLSTSPLLSGCNTATNSGNNSMSSKEQLLNMFTSPRGVDDIFDDVNPIYKDSSARVHIKSVTTPTALAAAAAAASNSSNNSNSDSLKSTLNHMPTSSSSSSSSSIMMHKKPPPPPPRPVIPKTMMTCQKCNCQFTFSDFMIIRPIPIKPPKTTTNNNKTNFNKQHQISPQKQALPITKTTAPIEYASYCERHYLQKFGLPGLKQFQALVRGIQVRKNVIQKKRQWRSLNDEMACKFKKFQKRRAKVQYNDITYNIYTSFPEFSRAQLEKYSALYYRYVNYVDPSPSPPPTTNTEATVAAVSVNDASIKKLNTTDQIEGGNENVINNESRNNQVEVACESDTDAMDTSRSRSRHFTTPPVIAMTSSLLSSSKTKSIDNDNDATEENSSRNNAEDNVVVASSSPSRSRSYCITKPISVRPIAEGEEEVLEEESTAVVDTNSDDDETMSRSRNRYGAPPMPLLLNSESSDDHDSDDDDDGNTFHSNNTSSAPNLNNPSQSIIKKNGNKIPSTTNGKKLNEVQLRAMMTELNFSLTDEQLKALIEEVDEDQDGLLTLKDFITLFRNRGKGELMSGLSSDLFSVHIVNVQEKGVAAARLLFDQKFQFQRMNRNAAEREVKELAKKRAEAKLLMASNMAVNKMNAAVASLMVQE